ncbi:MAG TPA: MFS transporter [Anaerolineae bacterium]|nr:MFS transporter [Anaerolineae bacterium]
MSLWRSLLIRNFALLWSGQTISRVGDQLNRIALAWWILEKTGSAAAMGTVLIFSSVPMILFALIGGVTVDRFHRPRVMFLSDVLRGIVVAIIAWLVWQDMLSLEMLFAFSAIFGIVDAFFQPAFTATVPEIVAPAKRPSANSLTTLSAEFAGIAGPAIGAGMVALGGTPLAFALDALSFFISAALLVPLLNLKQDHITNRAASSPLKDLRQGFQTVLSSTWLWGTIGLASIANFTIAGPIAVALPFLVNDNLNAGVGALGLIYSMFSVGSVISAIVLGRMKRFHHRGIIAYVAWVIGGLLLSSFGLPVSLWTVALAALGFGAALTVLNLIWANTLQEMVAPEQLGRVASIDQLGSLGLNPFGYAFAGWATDRIGAPLLFLLGGIITAAMGAVGLLSKKIREVD